MTKRNSSTGVEVTPTGKIATAATEAKAAEGNLLTPDQMIGQFAETLDKQAQPKIKDLYTKIREGFASEGQSRISIGRALNEARTLLGENFGKFVQDCVVKELRKSSKTCYNYMALASAAVHQFAANKVIATALFSIWSAEGCFDSENGDLKPAVKEAVLACGGIPDSQDSQVCEQWARKFVVAVDKLVTKTRVAQAGRKWTAEVIKAKAERIVSQFVTFMDKTNTKRSMAVLSALVVKALSEGMSIDAVNEAFDAGLEIHKNKTAKDAEVNAEQKAA